MITDFKEIHIGSLIKHRVSECEISIIRICTFFKCTEDKIDNYYKSASIEADLLLKWSKLLEYDFFRLYSQHLIFYSPQGSMEYKENKTQLPTFRKNIYTKEIIEFILELLDTKEKSKREIIEEYKIPKTTLYKWIYKYQKK